MRLLRCIFATQVSDSFFSSAKGIEHLASDDDSILKKIFLHSPIYEVKLKFKSIKELCNTQILIFIFLVCVLLGDMLWQRQIYIKQRKLYLNFSFSFFRLVFLSAKVMFFASFCKFYFCIILCLILDYWLIRSRKN